jgi:hypothetical protein
VKIRRINLSEINSHRHLSLSPRSYLNYRTHSLIEYRGETRTLKEWAEVRRVDIGTLKNRLNRGWSIERALATGPLKRGQWDANNRERSQFVTINGETKRVVDWIRDKGLKASTVWMRHGRGESLEQALTRPLNTRRGPFKCSRCCETGHTKRRCTASVYYAAMRQSHLL